MRTLPFITTIGSLTASSSPPFSAGELSCVHTCVHIFTTLILHLAVMIVMIMLYSVILLLLVHKRFIAPGINAQYSNYALHKT